MIHRILICTQIPRNRTEAKKRHIPAHSPPFLLPLLTVHALSASVQTRNCMEEPLLHPHTPAPPHASRVASLEGQVLCLGR